MVDTSGFYHADAPSRFNADHEQGFYPFFADSLRQRGFGLEVGFTGEVLDLGILDPGVDDGFVRAVISLLRVKQACNKAGAQGGTIGSCNKGSSKGAFDLFPVDNAGELHERMLGLIIYSRVC